VINRKDYLMGRDEQYANDFTEAMSENVDELLDAVNEFLANYTGPLQVNSGWRPATINNMTPHASKTSKHLECLAIDLNDTDGSLWQYVLDNLATAADLGLYFEHPNWTRTKRGNWVHAQLGGPKSRKRIFVPSTSPPDSPSFWSGKYDTKFDK
jgi:hypothetical protein